MTKPAPNGYTVLLAFVAAQVVYVAMLTLTLPTLENLAGGLRPFDMRPVGYDIFAARQLLEALGDGGRAFYLKRQIPLDLIYPALFAIAYYLVWRWLAPRAWPKWLGLSKFAWLAVFAGLADYAENAFIVRMLFAYPNLTESLVTTASTATLIKSGFTTITMISLVVMVLKIVASRVLARVRH